MHTITTICRPRTEQICLVFTLQVSKKAGSSLFCSELRNLRHTLDTVAHPDNLKYTFTMFYFTDQQLNSMNR